VAVMRAGACCMVNPDVHLWRRVLQPDITPDMLKPNTKLRESVSAFLKVPPATLPRCEKRDETLATRCR
jgi:hypothetical protein